MKTNKAILLAIAVVDNTQKKVSKNQEYPSKLSWVKAGFLGLIIACTTSAAIADTKEEIDTTLVPQSDTALVLSVANTWEKKPTVVASDEILAECDFNGDWRIDTRIHYKKLKNTFNADWVITINEETKLAEFKINAKKELSCSLAYRNARLEEDTAKIKKDTAKIKKDTAKIKKDIAKIKKDIQRLKEKEIKDILKLKKMVSPLGSE